MKTIVVYDTETTGLPHWKKPSESPDQPHIVQLCAVKVDADTREIIASIDVVVRPNGWDIPEETTQIHGITTEYAKAVGIQESVATLILYDFCHGSTRVAHNEPFDSRIIRIAAKRFMHETFAENWASGNSFCTAKAATPILQLPPSESMVSKNIDGFKRPSLMESYKYFHGREFENAHTAKADVMACLDVYWAIQEHNN